MSEPLSGRLSGGKTRIELQTMPKHLNSKERSALKGRAQKLEATFKVGKSGLSEPFLESIRIALHHQSLLKVKFAEFKEQKKILAPQLAEKTESQLVTLVGNVVVLYKEKEES